MQNHINAIWFIPNVSKESFVLLRNLQDIATRNLQCLESMSRPVENCFDDQIVHILTSKLGNHTRREWETKIGASEFPNWRELTNILTTVSGLRDRCRK